MIGEDAACGGLHDDINPETRRQLALLARRRRARTSAFDPSAPTDWRPTEVRDPEVRDPDGGFSPYFTDAAAWELIADKLEEGHEVEVVKLRKPRGARGYVMKIDLGQDVPTLYVKLQLLRGRQVVGRSFHYSERS